MTRSIQLSDDETTCKSEQQASRGKCHDPADRLAVSLLTGGGDRPYAFGLATQLVSKGAWLDVIGSDELDCGEFHGNIRLNFINLRGDQRSDVSLLRKMFRVSAYYVKLLRYACVAKPKIFHILWNNKFELIDRTLLMLYYRVLGKKIALTVHNVNIRKRDLKDSALNRFTLRVQYRLCNHIFVHTEQMKRELIELSGVDAALVTVIPFGINNSVPNTSLTQKEARRRLNISDERNTLLFFGNIATYKGLEILVDAFQRLSLHSDDYLLIIAGRPKGSARYWQEIQDAIREDVARGRVVVRSDYIPDDETELYFKAADVFVLPYRHIYQSGVLFLGYSFGLPVLAADVGCLKDEVIEGKTGFVFRPDDPMALANTIKKYFASDLYKQIDTRREEITDYARSQHSWDVVGQATVDVYADLLRPFDSGRLPSKVRL